MCSELLWKLMSGLKKPIESNCMSFPELLIGGFRFVQSLCKVIEERLPLYNAVITKLISIAHSDKDVTQAAVRRMAVEMRPKMVAATELFCDFVQEAIGYSRHLANCSDEVITERVQMIGIQIVNAPRMVVASMHGSTFLDDVISKLQSLHHMLLERYIDLVACSTYS